MTTTAEQTMTVITATSDFTEQLRAQGSHYHDRHPFHQRMNAGLLSRTQIQGWIANRFCYQVNLPRKDANILANCPVV